MDTITLTIDGIEVKTKKGKNILEAALNAGIYIPNLCILRYMKLPFGACRLCVVEVEGRQGVVGSCTEPAADGMVVHTNTPAVTKLRRNLLKLTLNKHPHTCLTCYRKERCDSFDVCLRNVAVTEQCVICPQNGRCELQTLVDYIGIDEEPSPYTPKGLPIERDNPFFDRDYNLCVLCGRCVWICQEVMGAGAITFVGRGAQTTIGTTSGGSLADSGCRFCGACVEVCPTSALMDRDDQWQRQPNREAAFVRCQHACPIGVDVPRYIRLISEGKYAQALEVIREKTPFIAICSLLCSRPCEAACQRGQLDEPVAIRALARFVVEQASGASSELTAAAASGKRVAIVGSGPAGLTAAYYLAKLGGHSVTIFDALPQPGGMLRVGIPDYLLPRDVLDAEIEIVNGLGVKIETSTRVDSLDRLWEQGYNAIFVAIGAHQDIGLDIETEDGVEVIESLSWLRRVNLGEKVMPGEKVAVIGGTSAAVDSARTALRLGAKEVIIIHQGTREEMSADPQGIEEAIQEGVKTELLATPIKIARGNGRLKLECARLRQGKGIPGSNFTVTVDAVISGTNRRPEVPGQFGLKVKDDNTIQVNSETLATSRDGVFAGGDVTTGPASVIEAIAAGRQAAISIDKYLGGRGIIDETLAPSEEASPWLGRDEGFAQRRRAEMPELPVDKRRQGFSQVELGLAEEAAREEAKRCMSCNIRFLISRLVAQPPPAKTARQ